MENNRLHIVAVDQVSSGNNQSGSKKTRREETQARMERLWHQDPEQFDPERDCMQRERVSQTMDLIKNYIFLDGKLVTDLGCGGGYMTRQVRDLGCSIDAVDIAGNALRKLKEGDMQRIRPLQDCLPHTILKDDAYDLVLCTEVIAYLNPADYRLLFLELSRLVKPEGHVVCSTPLDIDTDGPLERFAKIAETEFNFEDWVLSYHKLYIRIQDFLDAPTRFVKGSRDREFREKEISKRRSLSKFWFKLNSTLLISKIWLILNFLINPLANFFRQSKKMLLALEKICRFLYSENGISHATFIGKRRPLSFPLPPDEIPKERKHKREVWE